MYVFDSAWMAQDRPGPDRDRLTVARLDGIARRHARWGGLTEAEKEAGEAELREVAGQRSLARCPNHRRRGFAVELATPTWPEASASVMTRSSRITPSRGASTSTRRMHAGKSNCL